MADPLTLIRVADSETTALDDPKELVEIGWTDVRLFPSGWAIESGPHARIVKPGMPISPSAMSAHHLQNADVADGMAPDEARALINTGADFICCHHMAFDRTILKPTKPEICTFKCAKDTYPNLESHKNGAIWYAESGVKPNTLVRFELANQQFQTWAIPSGGGVVRNMMVTRDGNLVLAESGVNRIALVTVQPR